jgi:hypothetical protein
MGGIAALDSQIPVIAAEAAKRKPRARSPVAMGRRLFASGPSADAARFVLRRGGVGARIRPGRPRIA